VKELLYSTELRLPFHLQSLLHVVGNYPTISFLMFDGSGNLARASALFLQTAEYTADELHGRPYTDIIRGFDSLQDLYLACARLESDALNFPVIEVKTKGGEWTATEAFAVQALSGGQAQYTLLYLPHFKKNRPSILQQFSDSFMRNVNLGIMVFDTNYRLVEISHMACEILGHKRECLLNKPIDQLFESSSGDFQLVISSLLGGTVVRNHPVLWQNGARRYDLLIDSNMLRDTSGAIAGAYIIVKDVSNLRSLEAQLHRSDRLAMIGQIAAGTAHEIRNPLTSIKGFIQLLQSALESRNLEREVGYLSIVQSEIDRINELVNEFLLLGKRKDTSYRPTSVAQTIHNILPIIMSEANLHSITVNYLVADNLPPVHADSELLKQVFLNICKNAIEAMEENGVLTIVERLSDDQMIHIDIHDTGSGIPEYLMDKIFDPFFTTKENGTGLGLAVCQRIVHDMGGQITVSSGTGGTTFTISLPAMV
jgi:PAS domain S-box-containing protein